MRTHARLAGAAAALAVALTAQADIVMSNAAFADDAGGTAFGTGSTTVFKAFGWTMGATAYTLDDVTLRVAAFNTGEARVSIWSGDTAPTAELIVLTAPAGTGAGYHDAAFTPAGAFTLEANTAYWVYVEPDDPGDGWLWGDTTPSTLPTGVGAGIGFVFNGNPSSFFNVVTINGTVVPAPGAAALLGLGGMAAARRGRSRRG